MLRFYFGKINISQSRGGPTDVDFYAGFLFCD
jgi:hypothetical protein